MSHSISIRVFDENGEISKISLEDVVIHRQGILTDEGGVRWFDSDSYGNINYPETATLSIPVMTASMSGGKQYLLLWSDDEESDTNEFRMLIANYLGTGVDADGDGVGTISTSAEKSLNYGASMAVSKEVDLP